MEQIVYWFSEYGYWILFVGLLLEFLFLPFPGATVMGYAGVLAYQGTLHYALCVLLAGLGTATGMSLTYFIGYKLGAPFFEKYGAKFFMGPARRKSVQVWFNRFGNKIVFISFFVPGIRHFTGYFSGIMKLNVRTFLLFTWTGAFTWVTAYVSLGYILGPKWEEAIELFKANTLPLSLAVLGLASLYVWLKWLRYKEKEKKRWLS